jgi:hypothetical protein
MLSSEESESEELEEDESYAGRLGISTIING